MRHTFLHLSDLHYRPGWPEGMDLVWQAFCADLATQLSHYDDPHLVFSGDLVFAGGTANLYSDFATHIAAGLTGHFSRESSVDSTSASSPCAPPARSSPPPRRPPPTSCLPSASRAIAEPAHP